jgi:hypothetical protein
MGVSIETTGGSEGVGSGMGTESAEAGPDAGSAPAIAGYVAWADATPATASSHAQVMPASRSHLADASSVRRTAWTVRPWLTLSVMRIRATSGDRRGDG